MYGQVFGVASFICFQDFLKNVTEISSFKKSGGGLSFTSLKI